MSPWDTNASAGWLETMTSPEMVSELTAKTSTQMPPSSGGPRAETGVTLIGSPSTVSDLAIVGVDDGPVGRAPGPGPLAASRNWVSRFEASSSAQRSSSTAERAGLEGGEAVVTARWRPSWQLVVPGWQVQAARPDRRRCRTRSTSRVTPSWLQTRRSCPWQARASQFAPLDSAVFVRLGCLTSPQAQGGERREASALDRSCLNFRRRRIKRCRVASVTGSWRSQAGYRRAPNPRKTKRPSAPRRPRRHLLYVWSQRRRRRRLRLGGATAARRP